MFDETLSSIVFHNSAAQEQRSFLICSLKSFLILNEIHTVADKIRTIFYRS